MDGYQEINNLQRDSGFSSYSRQAEKKEKNKFQLQYRFCMVFGLIK